MALACSSTACTIATDDGFSDDSGVDVKPKVAESQERLLKFSLESSDMLIESSKRNKRKSSEPKKRKDVLLMKRFRWDTDDEDNELDAKAVDEDIDDVFERERPSSGDSGCVLGPSTSLDLSTKDGTLDLSIGKQLDLSTSKNLPKDSEKKRSQKQWRKPKNSKNLPEIKQEPSFRQSVIRKHEPCLPSHSITTKEEDCPLVIADDRPHSSTASHEYHHLELLDGHRRRSVGRPRNYKSMSRQRRIEANARERTRVHTISAAFENLRRAVPAYAHNQKLSKLAILRIASAYIVALACLNDQDYSQQQTAPSFADCVEQCTKTIQEEGRSRRRSAKD